MEQKSLRNTALAFVSCIHQLFAQESDDNEIHFLYARKFCGGPASEVGGLEQSCYSASIKRVLVCITYVCSVRDVV